MGERRDLSRHPGIGRTVERVDGPIVAPYRVEDGSGDAIGQRRLADTLRTADEPGMVQPALPQSLEKGALALPVAEKGELLARMRRALETVGLRLADLHAPSCGLACMAGKFGEARLHGLPRSPASTSSGSSDRRR